MDYLLSMIPLKQQFEQHLRAFPWRNSLLCFFLKQFILKVRSLPPILLLHMQQSMANNLTLLQINIIKAEMIPINMAEVIIEVILEMVLDFTGMEDSHPILEVDLTIEADLHMLLLVRFVVNLVILHLIVGIDWILVINVNPFLSLLPVLLLQARK